MRGVSAVDATSSWRRRGLWLPVCGLLLVVLPAIALTWSVVADDTPLMGTVASAARESEAGESPNGAMLDGDASATPTGTASGASAGPRLDGRPRAVKPVRPQAKRSFATGLALLRRSRDWEAFLEVWGSLPGTDSPTLRRERVDRVLTGLEDPVIRQNTIFLVALTWPWDEGRPWLEDLRGRPDPEDAEDALLALAFSGESAAVEAFRLLARARSLPALHQVAEGTDEPDAGVRDGTVEARRVLRSYRAIEVLDREPYYKIVPFHVSHFRGIDSPDAAGR